MKIVAGILFVLIILMIGISSADSNSPLTAIQLSGTEGNNGWNTSDVLVTLIVTDNSGTGISYTTYRIDSGNWINYVSPFAISNEGITSIEYYSVDNLNNIETTNSKQVKIDKTPPTIAAPADLTKEATSAYSWGASLRYAASIQKELNKFTKLMGVYSGHAHRTTNVTILGPYGNAILYSTIEPVFASNVIDYTSINGNDLDYRIIDYTSGPVSSTGQLRFIVVGDEHIYAVGHDDRLVKLQQAVDYVNDKSDIDFAVFTGEVTSSGENVDLIAAKNVMNNLIKPHYNLPGNHDVTTSTAIEYADTTRNWISSINTNIIAEGNIKQEGLGSLKITTNPNSIGDTILADIRPKDLSGNKYIDFWIRSSMPNTIKAGFGEQNITENELVVNIPNGNVWQKVRWDISGISNSNKDSITKFGFTIMTDKSADIYVDNIIAQLSTNYEDNFGPQAKIDNVNGYQLLFVGIWEEDVNTQTGINRVAHWNFDFDNPNIDKNKPTLVFVHGPIQTPFDKIIFGNPIVADNLDTSPVVTNNAPVDMLPVGKNTVIWKATDDAGNSATDIQYVTITDSKPPLLTVPADITINAKGLKTNVDLGEPVMVDIIDPIARITNNAPIDGFPIGTTEVIWTATDSSGNKLTKKQYVTIQNSPIDTIPPVITLLGNNPVNIQVGSSYVDAGATASDNIDGDITGKIIVVNPVDINTVGTYTITYDVIDLAGNPATQVTRTVNVVAYSPPITIISLSGTQGDNGWYISNVAVTLTSTADAGVANTKYRINSGSWIDYVSPFTISNEGTTTIYYYSTDNLGNIEPMQSYLVNIDKTPPTRITNLKNITYASTYINWTWTDPATSDFARVMVYINGLYKEDVLKGVRYYNATGLIPLTSYKINTHTVDSHGNINYTWWNHSAKTAKDSIPPASISGLKNITYARTYINWTWQDPSDVDFSKVMIYINGVFKTNVTKGKQYYNRTSLKGDTNYEIGTHTIDNSGNINQAWANNTAKTAP